MATAARPEPGSARGDDDDLTGHQSGLGQLVQTHQVHHDVTHVLRRRGHRLRDLPQRLPRLHDVPHDLLGGDGAVGRRLARDQRHERDGDGDWVVVRRQPVAENGEIVAAMIDGEATVKTLKRIDGHVWLMPHNPAYSPIPGDESTILGRVVSVLRSL